MTGRPYSTSVNPPAQLTGVLQTLQGVLWECQGHRFGMPGYDVTLDHIYDTVDAAMEMLRRLDVPDTSDTP